MASPGTHVTRAVQKLTSVTSQIFRCHGLQKVSPKTDRLGRHDLIHWTVFGLVMSAWFFGLFLPQRQRLQRLEERSRELQAQLTLQKMELQRRKRSINDLTQGNPLAWERVARERLGWIEPGEVTDVIGWRQTHPTPSKPIAPPAPPSAVTPPPAPPSTPAHPHGPPVPTGVRIANVRYAF